MRDGKTPNKISKTIQETLHKRNLQIAVIVVVVLTLACTGMWSLDIFAWDKEPIEGNVLNLPYTSEWYDTDQIQSPWKNMGFHVGLMYRSLLISDSSFENVEVDLAETYEVSDDGLTYIFQMKDGIVWSDGEDLTVEDVVFSIEAVLLGEDVNGIYTTAFLNIEGAEDYVSGEVESINGLVAEGDTITIYMDTVYPAMEQTLAQFVILPEHVLGDEDLVTLQNNVFWADPVVSGMYKVGEIVSYETVQLVRNELYVGEEPNIDEVILHIDYKNADLDYYSTNNSTEIINYRSMRGMEEYEVDILFYRYLVFNMCGVDGNQNEAMQDETVREAISYAIDREGILSDLYFDSGEVINSGVPTSYGSNNGYEYEYNPEKAKELLEASSYDTSRPLQLIYYYTDSVSRYCMELIAADLEAIGFEVEITQALGTSELYDERDYDIMLKGLSAFSLSEWYLEYDDSNANMSMVFGGETAFESLVQDLNTEVDKDEISETLLELQALEQDLIYKYPLFTLNQSLFIREERVDIPDGVTFGNTWYKYDVDFENWSIKLE